MTPMTAVRPRSDAGARLLIVDDRRENLLATHALLRPLGAEIITAQSGEEALEMALRHEFALILLDVQMPGMDGFETARLMKSRPSMQNVPIIFVTALSKEDHFATEAAEIGAVDYIFKPINSEILRSKVKVYLDLYRQRREILALNAALKQQNEELERFAYICSHDMQEPVRMMNAYSGFLAEATAGQLDEGGERYLRFIRDNAARMQGMIRDILAFSRVGREDIRLERVDTRKVFEAVVREFEAQIAESGATIMAGELPVVETSPTLVLVLLQNLIGNALKFQDGVRTPDIHVSAVREGRFWRFEVRDNGIGIDPAFRDRIFTIVQRYHRKEDYPGTGIGLSTCRKFIELVGGSIDFASHPGEGTVFTFRLPAREAQANA